MHLHNMFKSTMSENHLHNLLKLGSSVLGTDEKSD